MRDRTDISTAPDNEIKSIVDLLTHNTQTSAIVETVASDMESLGLAENSSSKVEFFDDDTIMYSILVR